MTTINGTSAQTSTLHRLAAMYLGNNLPDAVELLDHLHTAASDGSLQRVTTLSQDEVVSLLQEMIFIAQETLDELGVQAQKPRRAVNHDNVVRLVQKR